MRTAVKHRLRLPRGPVTLAHLEANPRGSLVKLAHQPGKALALLRRMMKLVEILTPLIERDARARMKGRGAS